MLLSAVVGCALLVVALFALPGGQAASQAGASVPTTAKASPANGQLSELSDRRAARLLNTVVANAPRAATPSEPVKPGAALPVSRHLTYAQAAAAPRRGLVYRGKSRAHSARKKASRHAFGKRLDDGLQIDGAPTLQLSSARNPVRRPLGDGAYAYANIAKDTDVVVEPRQGGYEFLVVARSAESPESQDVTIDLPADATLAVTKAGGVEVKDAAGERIQTISAPLAKDASGKTVPSKLTAVGRDRLRLTFPHVAARPAYPVVVDPVVLSADGGDDYGLWWSGNPAGISSWTNKSVDSGGAAWGARTNCYEPVSCYGAGPGLYVYANPGINYAPGSYSEWSYALPAGRTTYFTNATFLSTYFARRGDTSNALSVSGGIRDGAGAWTGVRTLTSEMANQTVSVNADRGTITAGRTAVIGLYRGATATRSAWEELALGGHRLTVDDPEAPTIAASIPGNGGPTSAWVRGNLSITPTATDPGFGVKQWAFNIPTLTADGSNLVYPVTCTGLPGGDCPTSSTPSISWDSTKLLNGLHQASLWATDAGSRVSAQRTWTVKVDNAAPKFTLSGYLAANRNGSAAGDPTGLPTIKVDATDGTVENPRSGVKSITIKLDDRTTTVQQSCPATTDNCVLSASATVNLSTEAPGTHNVSIDIEDRVGNHATDSFTYTTNQVTAKPITAVLQGTSQKGWVTDAQLRAEYDKWSTYPYVSPALRSTSADKDDAKLLAWEAAGLKYFYTAVDSDYRFSGSMYAPAASPDAVMARTNNSGLYFTQLITQLTADSSWNWQTGLGKVNWDQVDAWVMQAKDRGKKVIWNEPGRAWEAVNANATALAYFKKWGGTVVVAYGTNFADQVDAYARPQALKLASATGARRGVSVQAFNFTDRSQAVTRAGVAKLAKDALDSGSTTFEFSGASADQQPGSQFLLGAQDFLSTSSTSGPPKATGYKGATYTALVLGLSQLTRSDNQQKWSSDLQLRREYNLWNAKANVSPALRGMSANKNDPTMAGWEDDGYKYYWTAASSDFTQFQGESSMWVSQEDGEEVLRRSNSLGLYLHEAIANETARSAAACTAANGGNPNGCPWQWDKAIERIDWGKIDYWVSIARDQGKKIWWSEPSHAWPAVLNDAGARYWFSRWGNTMVTTWATNFPADRQIEDWAKPGAIQLASQFGTELGQSVQSWYFRDKKPVTNPPITNPPTPADPNPTTSPTAATTQALANDGKNAGARFFQIEGCGECNDMSLDPYSPYMQGIRSFLDGLASASPPALQPANAVRVPLYGSDNRVDGDHRLSRSRALPAGYVDQGIAGYVYDRRAPGSVPFYELYSADAKNSFYTTDWAEVLAGTQQHPDPSKNWWQRYEYRGIVGYVMPERHAETVKLEQLWNNNASVVDHAYTTSGYLKQVLQSRGYESQPSSVYLFDRDGNQTSYDLHRLYNASLRDTFLTPSAGEVTQYQQPAYGYTYQRKLGKIYTEPIDGAIPLYEAYSGISTDHYYTTNPYLLYDSLDDQYLRYANPRVVGYIPKDRTSEAVWPLHQLWYSGEPGNPGLADHFYTTDAGERSAKENGTPRYLYQEVAGYLVPTDTTPPSTAKDFGATFAPEDGITDISWEDSTDGVIDNGTAGSGLDHYSVRVSRNGGAWSGWFDIEDPLLSYGGSFVSEKFAVEVRSVDSQGNVSAAAGATVYAVTENVTVENTPESTTDFVEITPQPSTVIDQDGYAEKPDPILATQASTDPFRLCVTSPCNVGGSYDRRAAVHYAMKWFAGKNPNFKYFGVGDCTNFVSQALKYGGMRFLRTKNGANAVVLDGGTQYDDYVKGKDSWWSLVYKGSPPNLYRNSESWSLVQKLYDQLKQTKQTTVVPQGGSVRGGDIIFFTHGGSISESKLGHVSMITGVRNGKAWIAQHSSKKTHRTLAGAFKSMRETYRGPNNALGKRGQQWQVFVLRPTYTAANPRS